MARARLMPMPALYISEGSKDRSRGASEQHGDVNKVPANAMTTLVAGPARATKTAHGGRLELRVVDGHGLAQQT